VCGSLEITTSVISANILTHCCCCLCNLQRRSILQQVWNMKFALWYDGFHTFVRSKGIIDMLDVVTISGNRIVVMGSSNNASLVPFVFVCWCCLE